MDTSSLPKEVSTSYELPESIIQLSQKQQTLYEKLSIEVDNEASLGIRGLTVELKEQLTKSELSKSDIKSATYEII